MIWSAQADHITLNFLNATFHKFYLIHSWITWPNWWCIVFEERLTNEGFRPILSSATFFKEPQHNKPLKHYRKKLNRCRTWVQALFCLKHSSIVFEVIMAILRLFIFFFKKILRTQKGKPSKNQLTKQK